MLKSHKSKRNHNSPTPEAVEQTISSPAGIEKGKGKVEEREFRILLLLLQWRERVAERVDHVTLRARKCGNRERLGAATFKDADDKARRKQTEREEEEESMQRRSGLSDRLLQEVWLLGTRARHRDK